jgi:hypothetical protein
MSSMNNLTYLFASANAWEPSPVPAILASLTQLQELGLKSTGLTGPNLSRHLDRFDSGGLGLQQFGWTLAD